MMDGTLLISDKFLAVLGIPGGWETIIILVVVLIFFGNRIPGIARSLGSGITEFKSGLKEGSDKSKGGADTERMDGEDS